MLTPTSTRKALAAFGLSLAAQEEPVWQPMRVPGYWESAFGGITEERDGFCWYQAFVQVPEAWRGQELVLELGRIDDCDETWFNEVLVGSMGTREPYHSASDRTRRYTLDQKLVRYGDFNLIAVRVFDGGGAGGISHGPVRLCVANEAMHLEGTWQVCFRDDPNLERWPFDPRAPQAHKILEEWIAKAGGRFGRTTDFAPLPGTAPLVSERDLASDLVDAVDRFLLQELQDTKGQREQHFKRSFETPESYAQSLEPNRIELARILGMRDARATDSTPEVVANVGAPLPVAHGDGFDVLEVRWRAFGDVHARGLLLVPKNPLPIAQVIAVPDASQTPEELCDVVAELAASGCRVLIPALIDRHSGTPKVEHSRDGQHLTNREFLYRSAFELGRHLIGYELQEILAAVDWMQRERAASNPRIGVLGWGEGGRLALYAAVLDARIEVTCVSGSFEDRTEIWRQPINRNVFGLLQQFGDAELASMVAPRALLIEAARAPELELSSNGGAPATLTTPPLDVVREEFLRAKTLVQPLVPAPCLELLETPEGKGPPLQAPTLQQFLSLLAPGTVLSAKSAAPLERVRATHPQARATELRHEINRHNQTLLTDCASVRDAFMSRLDVSNVEAYSATLEEYRRIFREQVIGWFERPLVQPSPRTRKIYDEESWTGYEVLLDVWEGVPALGILLLPRGYEQGEPRPVVVCQHGLEGRPRDTIEGDHPAYGNFAARLAERGFIVFAPQNLYLFGDRFRSLQRKLNPLGKTLFSVITAQHQQILQWLKSLPQVDPKRIAFYGLSYGGKTAMRVPALLTDYCLSICSADFNEWVWKNASTHSPYSYVWSGEYEIFEFDLGNTFNYAEMAKLIAPRPFMVERGHFDGVAPDEMVAHEFAKVQFLYHAQLRIPERLSIDWFVGPHTIHADKTFEFLHRHLRWPE